MYVDVKLIIIIMRQPNNNKIDKEFNGSSDENKFEKYFHDNDAFENCDYSTTFNSDAVTSLCYNRTKYLQLQIIIKLKNINMDFFKIINLNMI